MAGQDQYKTILTGSTGEYKEKGSKFIAYAYPFKEVEKLKEIITVLKKQHIKASHWCFAYSIGNTGNVFRYNDDGEPSGSAGLPIYNQIRKNGLSDILIVVVRYFGGTKLGVPGLIRSYKNAAVDAIENSNIKMVTDSVLVSIAFDYSLMSQVMSAVKILSLEIIEKKFNESPTLTVNIPKSEHLAMIRTLKAKIEGISEEQVDPQSKTSGYKITVP